MNRKTFCSLAAGSLAITIPNITKAAASINVAIVPIDSDAQFYYADTLGYFKQRGLDVNLTSIGKGSAILAAVIGGSVDVGVANPISVITAYKRGVDLTCIAPSSFYESSSPSTAMMVANGSPIKGPKDLNGKTIGVNALKDLTQLGAMAWIDKNGGDSSKVKFAELGFPQMIPALVQNRVDAIVVAEPILSTTKGAARILSKPYDAVAPLFPVGCFFVTSSYARENAAMLGRLVDTLRDAGAWANAHQRQSADILAKVTKTDPAIIASMTRVVYSEQRLTAAHLQPVIDLCAKYGIISANFPASEIVWTGSH
jgi:NitT/TauT family transport system substrate-binding protein